MILPFACVFGWLFLLSCIPTTLLECDAMTIDICINANRTKLSKKISAILAHMHISQCDIYNLQSPVTVHVDSKGVPANAFGAYRKGIDGRHHIYIRPRKHNPLGIAHTLAHELRHAYQFEQGWLSTMQGGAWNWYGKGAESLPPVLCDGSDNDPSEQDADLAAMAYCQRAWAS